MNSAFSSVVTLWPWTTLDLLNHLWQSTVVGLGVFAILRFVRGLTARTRRLLGWMALVKFALPTGFLVNVVARLSSTSQEWAPVMLARPIILPAFVARTPTATMPGSFAVGAIALIGWAAVFAGLLASWLVRGQRLRRKILAEVEPLPASVELLLARAAKRVGLAEIPRCLSVASTYAPGVLGLLSPIVILPRGLEATLKPAELEAVLVHELVHLRRRDNLWSAVQAFFVRGFWFHPLVWWLNRELNLETEQSCDERVLELTGDPDTYAGGIVKAVRHALGVAQPGLLGATTPPVLARVKNILTHGTRPDRPFIRRAAVSSGVLLLAFSGYAGSFAAQALTFPSSITPAAVPTPLAAAPEPKPVADPAARKKRSDNDTLSVDFPNEDVRRIIRNIADLFEIEVALPVELRGKTTVKLNDVTWQQIFHEMLTPIGYTFVEEGKVVRIVRLARASATSAPLLIDSSGESTATRSDVAEAQAALPMLTKPEAVQAPRPTAAKITPPEMIGAIAQADSARQAEPAVASRTAVESAGPTEISQQRSIAEQLVAQQNPTPRVVINAEPKVPAQEISPNIRVAPLPSTKALGPASPAAFQEAPIQVSQASTTRRIEGFGDVEIFDVSQLDQAPVPTFQPPPQYPFAMRKAGIGGSVLVDFVVDTEGNVQKAYAVRSSQREFEGPAVGAISKWKFRAGQKGGKNVFTHMQVPILFSLQN
jgi:TonB family protein